MAISASSVWEVRSTGSDNNGGSYIGGSTGTDYSQSNTPILSVSDGVTNGTSTVTSVTGGFTAAMVGNGINIAGAYYQIATVTTSNDFTVDRTISVNTGLTMNVGGALANLATALANAVGGNYTYIGGSFTTAATIACSVTAVIPNNTVNFNKIIGYGSTRNDGGRATIQLITNTGLTCLNITTTGWEISYLTIDCNSLGTSTGVNIAATYTQIHHCEIKNFTTNGIIMGNIGPLAVSNCEIHAGVTGATGGINIGSASYAMISRCWVHNNACTGLNMSGSNSYLINISYNLITNNTGATSDGIIASWSYNITNNTIHGNGRDGIRNGTAYNIFVYWKNNILTNNAGYGINFNSGNVPAMFSYDGNYYGTGAAANTLGTRNNMSLTTGPNNPNPYTNVFDVSGGNPYVNSAGNNFSLNSTAGAGLVAQAAAQPGVIYDSGLTGYLDMGCLQHQASSSGSTYNFAFSG